MEIIYLKTILVIVLLVASAFFSGSETAFFSLSRYQVLKLKERPKGEIVAHLLEQPSKLLISILIGNETVNVLASALLTSITVSFYGQKGKWITIGIMTPLLLLFGEITPKTIAFKRAESFSLKVAPVIAIFIKLVTPIRNVIKYLLNAILSVLPEPSSQNGIRGEGYFLSLIEDAHREGEFQAIEKEIISNFLRFRKKIVSEIMVPRPDIYAISLYSTVGEVKAGLKKRSFSRLPVFDKDMDDVVGILKTKFLLGLPNNFPVKKLKNDFLPPYFVPETKNAEDLFWELQKKKLTIALVVDEYGNIAGLITIEDLLEEIFGEIYDEFDIPQNWCVQLAPGHYRVLAQVPLKDFNYFFKTNFVCEENTLAGFIISVLGRIPRQGERFTIEGFEFVVTKAQKRRLIEVEVIKRQ